MTENMYSAPQSPSTPPQLGGQAISSSEVQIIADHISGTRPWMMFFVVLFAISFFLMLFAAVAIAAVGFGESTAMSSIIGAFYVFLALIYVFFGWLIYRAARSARQVSDHPNAEHLIDFCNQNRRLWRTWGVATIVIMGIYVLGIVAAILLPITLG